MSEFKPGDEVAVRAVVLGEVAELPDGSVLNAMLGRVWVDIESGGILAIRPAQLAPWPWEPAADKPGSRDREEI